MKLLLLALLGAALFMGADARCPNDCSGHGTCGAFDMCTCYQNWQSADCSERTCQFGLAFVDTPQGDLNGDQLVQKDDDTTQCGTGLYCAGVLGVDSPSVQWSTSVQYEYWPADDGAWSAVTEEGHFYRECSNKGLCDRKAGNCKCFDGYEGIACERTVCPNACSGHGTCESLAEMSNGAYTLWDRKKTFACDCDPEYSGPDCSSRECPMGDDPLSTGQDTEVQTITTTAEDTIGGTFKLQFTDSFGETWTTADIVATGHGTVAPLSETAQSAAIKAALQAIPNSRIQSVTATQSTNTNGAIVSVTFTSNPGDLPLLACIKTDFTHSGTSVTLSGTNAACTVAQTTQGSTEEQTCSNRGLCDYSTGLCKCFKGYTSDDCSTQSALAY